MVTFWLHWFNAFERAKGLLCEIYIHCMRVFLLALASFLSLNLIAQTGKIAGKVISSKTGEALVGATITINTPARKALTDQTGRYTLGNLPSGSYTVIISYVGYDTKEVSEIAVKDGDVTDLNINLEPRQSSLETVTVRSKARAETQGSLLIAQKNSAVVSDGISAELIRRTPDRNTSDVLKRVSGVSIQDNKFAVVRGLNDRYNAAYLNGAPLPSSENDRKAFAFDIFPANMLENLVILKTASPDMPGEFAGGVININTSSIPSKNFTSVSVGTGINTITTFKDGLTYKGGKTDWIGLDDGARALPKGLPNTEAILRMNPDERAATAKLFTNNSWGINTRNILPNLNLQFTQGLNVPRKGAEYFGMLLSLTYNKSFAFTKGELNSYEFNRQNPNLPATLRSSYADNSHSETTLAGLVANFSLKLNSNNKISFKNILSINSEDRVINREGRPDVPGDPDFMAKSNALWFTSNFITSSQIFGDHNLSKAKLKVNWLLGYGLVKREIPDLRQLTYSKPSGGTIFTANVPVSTVSNDNSGSRFYTKTDENIYSSKVDINKSLDKKANFKTQLKLGAYFQYRDRNFDGRVLGFGQYRPISSFDRTLQSLPQEKIFAPENLGIMANGKVGFLLLDGTSPVFAYDASSTLFATYLMADSRIGKKLRAIYGVRYEYFNQKLNSFLNFTDKLNLNTKKSDFLPSVNLVYSLNAKQNLRVSYSKTLNRPEFRELAPFPFYDFSNRITVTGNPNLVRATIDNFDLRYELYPGKGQLVSISGFYKNFTNPIELVSDPNNQNSSLYQNALSCKNYGLEVEFRTLLSTLFGAEENKVLGRFTFAANGSYIYSQVKEAPFAGQIKTDVERPLQGQSPYLFNSSLSYNDADHFWSATLSANRVGQRIFIVGSINEADWWEQGRTIMDFQLVKSLLKEKLELKFNYRDMLRQKQVFFLDRNSSNSYDKKSDYIFQTKTFGSVISLTASYKF